MELHIPTQLEDDPDQGVNRPNDLVTNAALDAKLARMEIRLMRSHKPQWQVIMPAAAILMALLGGVWGLAINPINELLRAHSAQLEVVAVDLLKMKIDTARTADTVERIDRTLAGKRTYGDNH